MDLKTNKQKHEDGRNQEHKWNETYTRSIFTVEETVLGSHNIVLFTHYTYCPGGIIFINICARACIFVVKHALVLLNFLSLNIAFCLLAASKYVSPCDL